MKRKSIRTLALLCALALLLCLAGCGNGEINPDNVIPESTGGKDLVKAEAADHVFSLNSNGKYSFSPVIATNHANQLICSLVYEYMVEVDDNFNVIPGLITDWSCSEDGKNWTFTIDTTHVFHDGTPVTGNDLRWTLANAINSDRYAGRFASVQGIGYDTDRMTVTLGIGNTQFVKLLNIPVAKTATFGDDHPMGSGPYMWNEDGTQLLAFTGHNGYDRLPVDVVYIKEYTNAADILSAFEDSLVDVAVNDPSSYTNLGYASTNETRSFVTTNLHYIAFNEESLLGRYSNVRSALSYAFDRSYFEELMHGKAVGTPVPMLPTCDCYPTELAASHQFDLERCRRILENYGIQDYDGDGRLEMSNTNNQDLALTLILSSNSSVKSGVARRFAEDMAKIGVAINVVELTWADFMTALEEGELEEGDFDMYYGEVKLRNDFDLTELLQVRNKDNESTNLNYTHSTDRAFETYINNYLAASNANRADQYAQLAQYLLDTGSLITIGFEKQEIIAHRGVIKGLDPNAGNPMYNFANWEIDLS